MPPGERREGDAVEVPVRERLARLLDVMRDEPDDTLIVRRERSSPGMWENLPLTLRDLRRLALPSPEGEAACCCGHAKSAHYFGDEMHTACQAQSVASHEPCRCREYLPATPTPAASATPDAPDGITEWRKKPVTITALRWTGDNLREVIAFTGWSRHPSAAEWEHFEEVVRREGLKIFTLEGSHLATPGDYIIRGVRGEFYPCKPDIFALTYEPALRVRASEGASEPVRFELRWRAKGTKVWPLRPHSTVDGWTGYTAAVDRDEDARALEADGFEVETRDLFTHPAAREDSEPYVEKYTIPGYDAHLMGTCGCDDDNGAWCKWILEYRRQSDAARAGGRDA